MTKKLIALNMAALALFVGAAQADTVKKVNPATGRTYQRFDTPLTWAAARDACQALGGYLATITSQAENDWILTNMMPGTHAWIGGTDQVTEGTWRWGTGEAWSYTNWASGEPNNWNGGEDYLQFLSDGTWNDAGGPGDPGQILPYLCEWEALYIDAAEIPDMNADSIADKAVLLLKGGYYYLRTVSSANGAQIRVVNLGAAVNIKGISLTSSGDQLTVLIARSTGLNVLEIRSTATLALVRTIGLAR